MSQVRPTVAQAKLTWETIENPSAAKVAKKMQDAGFYIHKSSILRWRRANWVELQTHPGGAPRIASPERDAALAEVLDRRDELQSMVDRAFDFKADFEKMMADESLTLEHLLTKDARAALIARILLNKAIASCANVTAKEEPTAVAAQLNVLKQPTSTITVVMPAPPPAPSTYTNGHANGNGKLIEHSEDKPLNMTQQAIAEFRNSQMKVVK